MHFCLIKSLKETEQIQFYIVWFLKVQRVAIPAWAVDLAETTACPREKLHIEFQFAAAFAEGISKTAFKACKSAGLLIITEVQTIFTTSVTNTKEKKKHISISF